MVDENGNLELMYEICLDDFKKDNYPMLLATFLENNDELFQEHIEEMYEDHRGEKMDWVWKLEDGRK